MQFKIDAYKNQSGVWAADAAIVKAVQEANPQGPISGMGKPNFDVVFEGKLWHQGESKPDPSTNIDSVQIEAPVNDGSVVIGVLLNQPAILANFIDNHLIKGKLL